MAYYNTKVNIDTGELNRKGEPAYTKAEFLVVAESVLEVETKVAEHFRETTISYEVVNVAKSKIEAVLD
jgi:hypothetical protein